MRTITIEKTVANFEELSVDNQQKVIEKNRDINISFGSWHQFVLDDFNNILSLLGYEDIKTRYSGFWYQGDGASFSAAFRVLSKNDKMRDRLAKLKEYAPLFFLKNKELLNSLLDLDYQLSGYHESIKVIKSGRYCHEYTMQCDNDNLLNVSRQLAKLLYKYLEVEYDYLTSDEAIKETILVNEYEFDLNTLEIA